MESGTQFLLGLWEKPTILDSREADVWEAPDAEIDARVALAFETWNVWRIYCDPPYWETPVATWAGRYGQDRVVAWWTNRQKQMGYALRTFSTAIRAGEVRNDGNLDLARHVGNAVRKTLNIVTEEGDPLWLIYKERADSVFKIDAAMAAVLSWQARCDALASGVSGASVYETRGMREL